MAPEAEADFPSVSPKTITLIVAVKELLPVVDTPMEQTSPSPLLASTQGNCRQRQSSSLCMRPIEFNCLLNLFYWFLYRPCISY